MRVCGAVTQCRGRRALRGPCEDEDPSDQDLQASQIR